MAQTGVACVDSRLFERYVDDPQRSFLGNFDLLRFNQRCLILTPSDFCTIEPLYWTFDFDLRSKKYGSCATDLQCDFILLGVVLNEC